MVFGTVPEAAPTDETERDALLKELAELLLTANE